MTAHAQAVATVNAVTRVNAITRACDLLHTAHRDPKRILCCIAMKRRMDTIFKVLRIGAATLLGVAALPLASAATDAVETRLEARKVVVAADGRERFVSAEAAKPGDVIEYLATYRNTTSNAVRNLEATLPIPANTELLEGSARPANAKASLDARGFADMPLTRPAARDGAVLVEQIPHREYRYLRWFAPELAAHRSLTFAARVRVLE